MEEMITASAAPTTGEVSTAPAAAPAPTASAPEPATVFGYEPEADPVGEDQTATQAGEEAPAPEANSSGEEPPEGADGQQPDKHQKKVGHAFQRESTRLKREYEQRLKNDPDRAIGRRLVEDLMARENMTEEQARQALDQRYAAAYAKRENVGEGVARDIELLKRRAGIENTPSDNQNEDFDAEARAAEIKSEIASMELPDGFNPDDAYADPEFAQLLLEMPTSAAVRVYAAERKAANAPMDIAEKLRARQQIPQAERPNAPVSPQVNYLDMSSEDFFEEKARREKMYR